jgi:hypothetical protein
MARYDERGREIPDSRPVEVPLMRRPLSLQDEIRRFVRQELSARAQDQGFESFEESDDFEVGDDSSEPSTVYEMDEEQELSPIENRSRSKRTAVEDTGDHVAPQHEEPSGAVPTDRSPPAGG